MLALVCASLRPGTGVDHHNNVGGGTRNHKAAASLKGSVDEALHI